MTIGRELLQRAIDRQASFAFETTLGGRTITRLLREAAGRGCQVFGWYVGLRDVELHVARVAERVSRGGHDIPESLIRERYEKSRMNLISLLPSLAELRVYDNSEEGNPRMGEAPAPRLILHLKERRIVGPADLSATPEWARPILVAAARLQG